MISAAFAQGPDSDVRAFLFSLLLMFVAPSAGAHARHCELGTGVAELMAVIPETVGTFAW